MGYSLPMACIRSPTPRDCQCALLPAEGRSAGGGKGNSARIPTRVVRCLLVHPRVYAVGHILPVRGMYISASTLGVVLQVMLRVV